MIGKTLGQRYYITESISKGGMGSVYKAKHKFLQKQVALKVLPTNSDEVLQKRFLNEALKSMACKQDNVVGVYDYVEAKNGLHFLVMEYVPGDNLKEFIENLSGNVPLHIAYDIILQICRGVREIHRHGIIHRDLKPENILVHLANTGHYRAVIVDFGIAKKLTDVPLTDPGTRIGTYAYMSPEQIEGSEDIDHRSDIYSLGIIFYFLLTGVLPFEENNTEGYIHAHLNKFPTPLKKVRRNLPRSFQKVISKAIAKKAGDRYQTLAEMEAEISEIISPTKKPFFKSASFWQLVGFGLLLGILGVWNKPILESMNWEKVPDSKMSVNRDSVSTYRQKADSYFTQKNYELAQEYYNKALKFSTNKDSVYLEQQIKHTAILAEIDLGNQKGESISEMRDAKLLEMMNFVVEKETLKVLDTCSDWLALSYLFDQDQDNLKQASNSLKDSLTYKDASSVMQEITLKSKIGLHPGFSECKTHVGDFVKQEDS